MSILDAPIGRLDGSDATLGEITGGRPALLVNVASKCGLTEQYTALEQIHAKYADRGFTVVGVPCNQFGGQEPGSSEGRHEVYRELVTTPDEEGRAGDITWNFEKFLVDSDGTVIARYSPTVVPDDERITDAIEGLVGA